MKTSLMLLVSVLLAVPCVRAATDDEVLMLSFLKYQLVKQVPSQVEEFAEGLDAETQAEIKAVADAWSKTRWTAVKDGLTDRFGDKARPTFEAFVANLTKMEAEENESYLRYVSRSCELPQPWPGDYMELRRVLTSEKLGDTVEEGGAFLGEVQTWAELKERGVPNLPPLTYWLARTEDIQVEVPEVVTDPLRAGEAELPEYVEDEEDEGGFLDDFASMRDEKRQRQVEEAKAAMEQVASERRAAEEDYASRKLAAAQKEAEAMKAHAQELAAVETEALKQRERTWGARLKRIVGATISAAGGAFIGEVGSRAGQEAADAVFN